MFHFAKKSASDTRGWHGVILTAADIPQSDGKIRRTQVIAFKVPYDCKDEVKAFVQSHGGTWNSFYKFWFIPVPHKSRKDALPFVWQTLIEFDDLGIIADAIVHAQLSEREIEWFQKQNRKVFSGLAVVKCPAELHPSVTSGLE